jgi:deazaflavin-dependent oxidoreductase (nitroreductase family)
VGAVPNDVTFKIVTGIHRTIFDVTNGRVLGRAIGMPVVKLTTTGRKSGLPRDTMLTAPVHDDAKVVLVASKGGAPRHPAWYVNLRDNPRVTITMLGRRREMVARTATAAEKAELWPAIVAAYKGYAGYQEKTERDIPVVILEPPA